MDAIVKMLEKHQPFFEKISRNIYLQAIKDGFLGCMPIVLTSSIFLLIATLPGVVGITLPQPLIDWCNKLYNFTMGVMGIMVAGTTAKNFTASMNRRMPAGKVLNDGNVNFYPFRLPISWSARWEIVKAGIKVMRAVNAYGKVNKPR